MSYQQGQHRGSGGGGGGRRFVGRPKFNIERLKAIEPPAGKNEDDAQDDEDEGADELEKELAPSQPLLTRGTLSPDQVVVYDKVLDWYRDKQRRQYLKFGGLAGTGKTTLISVLAGEMAKAQTSIVFGAYTGKAANVLGRKLKAAGIKAPCVTLHSLMYEAVIHDHSDEEIQCNGGPKCPKRGRIEKWRKRTGIPAGLVVVDEASMINGEIWEDLLSFGVPVLAVGDHGQLPPIGKDAVNLMQTPDLVLEKIHRQAEGNPILALAHFVRQGGNLHRFRPSDSRVTFGSTFVEVVEQLVESAGASSAAAALADGQTVAELMNNMAVICGKNSTRTTVNAIFRQRRGFDGPAPDPGDIVIALKNFKPVFNGMRGIFEGAGNGYVTNEYGAFEGSVLFPDDGFRVRGDMNVQQFGREKTFEHPNDIQGKDPTTGEMMGADSWTETGLLFDWGYALTCHKAQGSQFSDVVVCAYDAFGTTDERRRWLYTAVTRAAERLVVVR
jgi:exodeoxyribonuclease-5